MEYARQEILSIISSIHAVNLAVKGRTLPKQDIDDVFIALYRLEATMSDGNSGSQTDHVITKLITIMEQFFRCIVRFQLEDDPSKNPKKITLNPMMIDEIIDIVSKRTRTVTVGLIVSFSHSFQSTGAIDGTMQNYGIQNIFSGKNCLDKERYDGLFKLRHEFVHTINPSSKPRFEIMEYHNMTEELMQHVLGKYKDADRYFYMLKGRALRTLGDASRADECFEAALKHYTKEAEQHPDDADIQTDMGTILLELERYDEALECFDKVIEMKTNYGWAYYCRWIALTELKRYGEALECVDRIIEMDPDDTGMFFDKGATLFELGRHNEAFKWIERAIDREPYDADMYFNKGLMLTKLKRYDDALKCFDEVIEIEPYSFDGYYYKGVSLFKLGRHDEALECVDKVIGLRPYDLRVYSNKCSVLFALERYGEALECVDKVIGGKPGNYAAHDYKARILEKLGKPGEARKHADKAKELKKAYDAGKNRHRPT